MSAPPPRTPPGTPTKPGNTGGAHGATNSDDPDGQVTLPRPGSHIEVEARPELSLEGQVIRKNLLRRMFQRDVSPELIDERYILKQSIGKGAKGTVFLAEDGRLDRQLAIKLLHEQDSPIERTRLIREGQALAKLRHENIVQVYDAQNYEGQVYLAMEYIAGTTLRTWQREKPRGFRELLDVYRQAGAGLAAAHKAGFVHRDFKPENVLVEQATGRVCVGDFGLVKQGGGARPSTTLESPGALRATPTYRQGIGRLQKAFAQQQRVALARAMAPKPKVLLLDEPLSALDLKLRQEMRAELKSLQRETGITFIFVTHDQEEALSMSDRIAVMSAGELQQIGTPEDVYEHPANRFVADFIGDTNLLDATVEAAEGDTATCRIGGAAIIAEAQNARAGQTGWLSIRPERISIATQPSADSIPANIGQTVYLGTDTQALAHLEGGVTLRARF